MHAHQLGALTLSSRKQRQRGRVALDRALRLAQQQVEIQQQQLGDLERRLAARLAESPAPLA